MKYLPENEYEVYIFCNFSTSYSFNNRLCGTDIEELENKNAPERQYLYTGTMRVVRTRLERGERKVNEIADFKKKTFF